MVTARPWEVSTFLGWVTRGIGLSERYKEPVNWYRSGHTLNWHSSSHPVASGTGPKVQHNETCQARRHTRTLWMIFQVDGEKVLVSYITLSDCERQLKQNLRVGTFVVAVQYWACRNGEIIHCLEDKEPWPCTAKVAERVQELNDSQKI